MSKTIEGMVKNAMERSFGTLNEANPKTKGTKETFSVPCTIEVPIDRVADTLCAALEGGSNYWCEEFMPARYPEGVEWGHEAIAMCVPFHIVHEAGEILHIPGGKKHMMDTLLKMYQEFPRHFWDMEAGNEDAETGDVLFQLLCFGEVVYG